MENNKKVLQNQLQSFVRLTKIIKIPALLTCHLTQMTYLASIVVNETSFENNCSLIIS
ncbi:MAG: hypothetical protein K0S04_1474 [Herbinix sp.]|jgi:hypothetical protein|nr:hypothetical protein [Herbinix sp.]